MLQSLLIANRGEIACRIIRTARAMSDFECGRRIPDPDELREAILERRARYHGCKCGYPDWPGQCPGWRNSPCRHLTTQRSLTPKYRNLIPEIRRYR